MQHTHMRPQLPHIIKALFQSHDLGAYSQGNLTRMIIISEPLFRLRYHNNIMVYWQHDFLLIHPNWCHRRSQVKSSWAGEKQVPVQNKNKPNTRIVNNAPNGLFLIIIIALIAYDAINQNLCDAIRLTRPLLSMTHKLQLSQSRRCRSIAFRR